jgi:hypothetical protein
MAAMRLSTDQGINGAIRTLGLAGIEASLRVLVERQRDLAAGCADTIAHIGELASGFHPPSAAAVRMLPFRDRYHLAIALERAPENETDTARNARHAVYNELLDRRSEPEWLTSTVTALTQGIFTDGALDRMPILADALQDPGCDNEDLLNCCRHGTLQEQSWALYRIMFDLKINPDGHVTFTLPAGMSYYEAIQGIHDIRGQDPCVREQRPIVEGPPRPPRCIRVFYQRYKGNRILKRKQLPSTML